MRARNIKKAEHTVSISTISSINVNIGLLKKITDKLLLPSSVGKLFGIDIRLHPTLILFACNFGKYGYQERGLSGLFWGVAICGCIMATIICHELGHSLTARRYNRETRNILLTPFGGVASINIDIPFTPAQELLVTIAGPAVNFILVLIVIPFVDSSSLQFSLHGFINWICIANMAMLAFNLVPAFPMDGGRILRAILAVYFPLVKATKIAVWVCSVFAAALFIVGVHYTIWSLIIIMPLVFLAGYAELRSIQKNSTQVNENA